ncbi:unnamed protein product [Strongylus vulgaris]|uniref:Hormone-sensitive lipase n=1 Tax=Strongylus vulgaris TaxID=40348 RepID=A0A3P7IZD2_STRVU|nr:unnamed protein product [Strongylus vulgaris]
MMFDRLKKIVDLVTQLQELAPSYDYDENTPGNGFRSLVCICDTTVLHIISLQKTVSEQRGSFVFRLTHYCKELEAFSKVISFLMDSIPLFSPSVNRIFRLIGIVLASYSLSWEKGHGPIGSIINTGRFLLSPEQRASRIIKVTKEADIDFCKGFWNLAELSNNVPKWFSPNMAINELREINWVGPISLETTKGGKVRIPEPSAHTGPRPVQIRILSPVHRPHMSPTYTSNQQPASPYIVFHCHGGGYVATSSKSHETYLRMWAKLLCCTVVSVEYSLAPANPFPRPTEEVLFAYAWIVNNPQLVGWTGEKMCMVGDSAGGNLIMSVNLRLIELDVKKKPDGIVNSDPVHIHLSSTIFDNQLLNYLIKHPTTKDSLTVVDENGEVIEEGDDALLANPSVQDEKEKKRPGILNMISGNAASTAPNTPCEGNKGIPSSSSSNNFQHQSIQVLLARVKGGGRRMNYLESFQLMLTFQVHKRSLSQSLADTAIEEPCERKSHIIELLNRSAVPRDPLISPMYASDDIIRQLPPVYFVVSFQDYLRNLNAFACIEL